MSPKTLRRRYSDWETENPIQSTFMNFLIMGGILASVMVYNGGSAIAGILGGALLSLFMILLAKAFDLD